MLSNVAGDIGMVSTVSVRSVGLGCLCLWLAECTDHTGDHCGVDMSGNAVSRATDDGEVCGSSFLVLLLSSSSRG